MLHTPIIVSIISKLVTPATSTIVVTIGITTLSGSTPRVYETKAAVKLVMAIIPVSNIPAERKIIAILKDSISVLPDSWEMKKNMVPVNEKTINPRVPEADILIRNAV
ncbi:hypothetical protein AKJ50_02075 [candidate division MSBL1 archaeon SCGC-AAA382A13]|uniref:Uncharacterized protein n=1 Tax=candidate division MSBL1 archaeon SCGC-AAA382A13 TaxID=1698279 RepID=A0A133VE94_9EURY|nr:hypothetical protein AKJ50_02075 [candidate division MSBL1 archaeon SCGC-AAA382A13]